MSRDLAALEALRLTYGDAAAARQRRALLVRLSRTRLATPDEVLRLHEALVSLHAVPPDAATLRLVRGMLTRFAQRADLARHRDALAGSGLAGTDTPFRFFAETARRLALAHGAHLHYDWDAWDDPARLEELLPLLAAHGETPGLDEYDLGLRGWLTRMKPRALGDAAWVTRRLAGRVTDPALFERLHDGIDAPMVLRAGRGTPERTTSRWPGARVHLQRRAFERGRPDLRAALAAPPPRVRALARADGQRMHDLALTAMVTRQRDLDAFAYASPDDVRLVDVGGGLQFAVLGVIPERRLLLEAVVACLTLRNGVPIGYVLVSALHGSAEIAYNVFDAHRGADAAHVYAQVLAMTRALFGVDAFTVYPYQLGGAGNEEGLASGAWWFYRKLGFAPSDASARRFMRREEARMAKDPAHRSSRRTLMALGEHNVYWHLGSPRREVIGRLPLARIGLAVTDLLARRGLDEDRGAAACAAEARAALGGGPTAAWSAGERLAFERWAPLVLLLRVRRWSAGERRALLNVIRAKGGRRESDFVHAYDAHARLRAAIVALAQRTRE